MKTTQVIRQERDTIDYLLRLLEVELRCETGAKPGSEIEAPGGRISWADLEALEYVNLLANAQQVAKTVYLSTTSWGRSAVDFRQVVAIIRRVNLLK